MRCSSRAVVILECAVKPPCTSAFSNHFMSLHSKHGPAGYAPLTAPSEQGTLISNDFEMRESFELQPIRSFRDEILVLEQHPEPESGGSTMRMAFMNMANSILGAGIIGQPYAFKNSGLVGGIVLMVFLTFLVDWTLRLIVVNASLLRKSSYQDTVQYCFGNVGKALLLFSISSFAYGGCIAFCIIIGDTIPHVFKAFLPLAITSPESISGWIFRRNSIIILFTVCVSYPLSLTRDISKLAKASAFALMGMLIIVVTVVLRGPFTDTRSLTLMTVAEWTVNVNIAKGVSVISFALVCHHNTLFIYNSMKNPSIEKFARLTHIACFISMICCLVMGCDGYLTFGKNTKGNVLNNFKSDDNWVNVARFCFGLNMLTTLPLEVFVVRDVLLCIFVKNDDSELSSRMHYSVTTLIVFSAMTISLFTCNLGVILELIGATSASLMAYIIPPLCYLKLQWESWDHKANSTKQFVLKRAIPSAACIIFGVLVMVISSAMSIKDSINSTESTSCVD